MGLGPPRDHPEVARFSVPYPESVAWKAIRHLLDGQAWPPGGRIGDRRRARPDAGKCGDDVAMRSCHRAHGNLRLASKRADKLKRGPVTDARKQDLD